METGVYQILNKINNKSYIGSTSQSFKKRIRDHFRMLENKKHHSRIFQNSYNKYGKDAFEWKILQYCPKELCLKKEQWFIDVIKPYYNVHPNARSPLGVKRSQETIEKVRKALTGRPYPEEAKEKNRIASLGNSWGKGYKHSEEYKERRRKIMTGVPMKQYVKDKISVAINGIKRTEETKKKLSELKKKGLIYNYTILRPDGLIDKCTNLNQYAINNNISITSLRRSLNGFHNDGSKCESASGFKLINKEKIIKCQISFYKTK